MVAPTLRSADLDHVDALVGRLATGDRRALAKLLTIVDNGSDASRRRVLEAIPRSASGAQVIGVTGAPGAGKSSLVSALCQRFREPGTTVAVLAVDPSSPFSGGAVLGDSLRMQQQFTDGGVFIRSMAARKHLGGLSAVARQSIAVLDTAGFDVIIVETAGVGQSEVEIAGTADTTVVVTAPGLGDQVQASKAGVLEIADIFVVNKADRPGAARLHTELRGILSMDDSPDAWVTPIVRTDSTTGDGSEDLLDAISRHATHLDTTGEREQRRRSRTAALIREIALAELRRRYSSATSENRRLEDLTTDVLEGRADPYTAADDLLLDLRRTDPSVSRHRKKADTR